MLSDAAIPFDIYPMKRLRLLSFTIENQRMIFYKICYMKWLVIIFLAIIFAACEKSLLNEEFDNNPKGNFDAFWCEFDRFYGAFEPKHLNWDSLKVIYGSNIHNNTPNSDLYKSLCSLLASLNDGHASIYSSEFGAFRSWSRREKLYFSDVNTFDYRYISEWIGLVQNKYLGNSLKSDGNSGYLHYYGSIQYHGFQVGYLYIPSFVKNNFPMGFIEEAAGFLKNMDAVIIDLRYNGGGSTETFVKVLNLFTSEKKIYLKSKFRNGPNHNDFSDMFEHYTENNLNNGFFNKPIAIIVNSFTSSSSEHFLLGMKSQKGVFSVGDTTCGAFSTVHERIMPNGWIFRFGAQVIYTPEGNVYTDSKGRYLEGIGIAPDFYKQDSYISIAHGIDLPLDFTLTQLLKQLN